MTFSLSSLTLLLQRMVHLPSHNSSSSPIALLMILTFVIVTPPPPPLTTTTTTLSPNYFVLVEGANVKSYYDILQLKNDATLQDIKKAYRRLAVLHHPDRNIGNEEEATIKFREISEAYEVLSDEESRRQYDHQSLMRGAGSHHHHGSFGGSNGGGGTWSHERRNSRHYRDPFAQFNDVFKNDPFFAEAFKSLDDLFDKHFAGQEGMSTRNQNRNKDVEKNNKGGGLLWNIAKKWLPNIQVTTSSSSTFGGQTTYSSTSRKFGGGSSTSSSSSSSQSSSHRRGRSSGGSSSSSSTYTSRSTRTIIQNGQRVTIQSLEKDGNKIEEKYIGDQLIERKINGRTENIGRIAGVGREF